MNPADFCWVLGVQVTVGCVIVSFLNHPVYIAKPLIESLRFSQMFHPEFICSVIFSLLVALRHLILPLERQLLPEDPKRPETENSPSHGPPTDLGGGCRLRMWSGKMRMRSLKPLGSWVGGNLHEIWRSILSHGRG